MVRLRGVGLLVEYESLRNTRIGKRVAHSSNSNVHQFQAQKVKVTMPINAVTYTGRGIKSS